MIESGSRTTCHVQLATTKSLQDNSTWPTRHRDNAQRVPGGRVGQAGKAAGGQSAALARDIPFSHTPLLPPLLPCQALGQRSGVVLMKMGCPWLLPPSCHSPCSPLPPTLLTTATTIPDLFGSKLGGAEAGMKMGCPQPLSPLHRLLHPPAHLRCCCP